MQEEGHHSSMYSVKKWRSSIIDVLSRHQGEFHHLTEFCKKWQEETPGAPPSDRPGSFYATVEKFEDQGTIIFKEGAFYLKDQTIRIIPPEEVTTEIINEKITLIANSFIEIQKNSRKIEKIIGTRKENIVSIQDKIDRLKNDLEIEKTNLSEDERRLNISKQDAEKIESQLISMIRDYLNEQVNKN